MDSRVKFFKIFLIITILFDGLLSGAGYYLITKYVPQLKSDAGIMVLLLSVVFFMIAAVFVLFLVRKYPYQPVSNIVEGLTITFGIFTFFVALVDLLLNYVYLDVAMGLEKKRPNTVTTMLLYISIPSVISVTAAVIVAINSFRLLRIVRKNRWSLGQDIKNIGTNYE